MPELTHFSPYHHNLDAAQESLLKRVVEHFHRAQRLITLEWAGQRILPVRSGRVSWTDLFSQQEPNSPEITVTGLPLTDSWFSHTVRNLSLITSAHWSVAFLDTAHAPPGHPTHTFCMSSQLRHVLHQLVIPKMKSRTTM